MMKRLLLLELRRQLRQPLLLLAMLLQLLLLGWLLRAQLEQYLSLQAGGLRNLSVGNDLLTPLFGALAFALLFTAPLFAAGMRPALLAPYRRLSAASATHWLAPTLFAGSLLFFLVPLLVLLHLLLLRSASAIALWPVATSSLGLLLLGTPLLWLALALQLFTRQLITALALSLLAMALVAAAELQTLLPTPFGVFRLLRDGALPLAALGFGFACVLLWCGLLRLRQCKPRSLPARLQLPILLLATLASFGLPQRWQPDSAQRLSATEQQALQSLPDSTRLIVVSADPERQRDYLASLSLLSASNAAVQVRAVHPDALSSAERDALPGREGVLLSVAGQSAWLKLPTADLAAQSVRWLSRLQRRNDQFLVFLEGHGERSLFGTQARDLGQLKQALDAIGLRALPLQLQAGLQIPANTAALVLASPTSALLPAEQTALIDFVAGGGNLLWLREPDEPADFAALERALGVQRLPGTVLDLAGVQRGTPHPAIAVIDKYPDHAAVNAVQSLTALPWAAALEFDAGSGFHGTAILNSSSDSVLTTDPDQQTLAIDAPRGRFALGWALTRMSNGQAQRIAVLGDGHFLADTAINNYGNRALALAVLQWLAFGDDAIAAPDHRAADADLRPSAGLLHWYRWGLPVLLPLLLLLGLGGYQWRWRRQ
ncbi:MAG TPA: DUF4350 domain-containing protein [Permianibacter sp.]|nr:DUF4350 domain-containing protein [Permianibacter sp.]